MSDETKKLVVSMCGPIFNRIKMCFEHPQKNREVAENNDLKNFVFFLGEQVVPQWCTKNMGNQNDVNQMHNLVFLFAYKTCQVFQARVIHQIIDQNWDLKGFKCTLIRISQNLGIGGSPQVQNLEKVLEKMINV